MIKKKKGITLIALVITIIVLLILAGVSIAMLTGNNGILTQANKSKVAQIEGQVKEEVNLAVQAAKMYAEQEAVSTATGYTASTHLADPNDDIITEMEKDLTTGYSITGVNGSGDTAGTITVTYTTDSYKSATNNASAKITFTIKVTTNNFEITTIAGSQTINMTSTP